MKKGVYEIFKLLNISYKVYMKKINKKVIIVIIAATIILILIHEKLIKNEDFIETNTDFNIMQTEENVIEDENSGKIIIYITGEIQKEGVYELEENSRVLDAIEIAGGLKENANIEDINLAQILEDESKIYIPNKNDENIKNDNQNNIDNISKNTTETIKKEGTIIKSEKININTASQTELETLPGIGPSTALKIVNYRKEKGKFKNIEDIKNVSGIGESKFSKIKDLIKI